MHRTTGYSHVPELYQFDCKYMKLLSLLWGTIWGTFPSKKLLRQILFSDFCLVPSHSLKRITMTVSFVALACALWASNLDGSQFGGVVWRLFSTLTMHDHRRYCNYNSWYLWILLAQYAQLHSVSFWVQMRHDTMSATCNETMWK